MKQISKTVALALLRGYKWGVSPMFLPACRYVPSCSEYAMEAIERYGVVRGGAMAVWRIARCHPFAKGGVDPVTTRKMVEPNRSGELLCSVVETEFCGLRK